MKRPLVSIVLLPLAWTLAGCTAVVHDAVVKSYPSFEETQARWPALGADRGRVVVYWPRVPAAGLSPWGAGGMSAGELTVDGRDSTSIGDQTFVFADLPAGAHTLDFKQNGIQWKKQSLPVDVRAGNTLFVAVNSHQTKNDPPTLVDEPRAREALKTVFHNYKQSVPFTDKKGRGRPAM